MQIDFVRCVGAAVVEGDADVGCCYDRAATSASSSGNTQTGPL